MRIIGGPYRCDENGEILGPYTLNLPPPVPPARKTYRRASIIMTLALWVVVAAIGVYKSYERYAIERQFALETQKIEKAIKNAEAIPLTHTVGGAQIFGLPPEQAATGWWYSTDPSRVSVGPGGEIRPIYRGTAVVCVQRTIVSPDERQCWRVEAQPTK